MQMCKIIFLSCIVVFVSSCHITKPSAEPASLTKDAQNTLEWQGTYFGILPCASCAGIETEITLNKNSTFYLIKNYVGKDMLTDTLSGAFSWHSDQSVIALDIHIPGYENTLFSVRENTLIQLDKSGNLITGDLAGLYILTKTGNQDIEDKRWQLIEIFGKTIEGSPDSDYMVLHSKNQTIIARAHCNTLRFTYRIREGNSFYALAGPSTKMACGDSIEEELVRILSVADHVSLDAQTLSLSKGSTVLARFVLAP